MKRATKSLLLKSLKILSVMVVSSTGLKKSGIYLPLHRKLLTVGNVLSPRQDDLVIEYLIFMSAAFQIATSIDLRPPKTCLTSPCN